MGAAAGGGSAAGAKGSEEAATGGGASAAAASSQAAEGDAAGGGDDSFDLSAWNGKTPKMLLFEWFQKRQQPRPKIEVVSQGRRFTASVTVSGGLSYALPEDETFPTRGDAEQGAATVALLHLFPEQPLYRLMPPAFRALWLKWQERQVKAPKQQKEAAELVARDRFIETLCARPRDASEPRPKRRATSIERSHAGPG